jgi:hypothetical protein
VQVAGRDVWLMHPWHLADPPATLPSADGSRPPIVLAVLDLDTHARWPWSASRWDFVADRLVHAAELRWSAPAHDVVAALAAARSVHGVDNPHLSPALRALPLTLAPRLFNESTRRCRSFSAFWTTIGPRAGGAAPFDRTERVIDGVFDAAAATSARPCERPPAGNFGSEPDRLKLADNSISARGGDRLLSVRGNTIEGWPATPGMRRILHRHVPFRWLPLLSDGRAMALRVAAAPRRAVHLKAVVHLAACCRPGRAAVRRAAGRSREWLAAACRAVSPSAVVPRAVAAQADAQRAAVGAEAAAAVGNPAIPSCSSPVDSSTTVARDNGHPSTIPPKR